MKIIENFAKQSFEWNLAVVITLPFVLAAANEIVNTQSLTDYMVEGMSGAKIAPVEPRPLTDAEIFAYRL